VIDERNNAANQVEDQATESEEASFAPAEDAPAAEAPPGPGEGNSFAAHPEPPAAPPESDGASPGPGEGDSSAAHAAPAEALSVNEGPAEAAPPEKKSAKRKPAEAEPAMAMAEESEAAGEEIEKNWYILKVQSNRENSICDGLRRRVKIAGLEEYFGEVIVPTEEVREFKEGKARIVKRKLYPGYIVVQMAINDDTWFLVRETPGIGDFTGAGGKPTPMLPHEVEKILRLAGKLERPDLKTGPRPLIPYKVGDKVRIEEGNFQNFEGEVNAIDETNGRVTIMIQIFNRTTPVELEHWQVKPL
jgi:transcriptional antiterminator NusG